MMRESGKKLFMGIRARQWIYAILLAAMAFTGFGEMPVYKRYYVSAIPGLGWSADYFVTLAIHYMGRRCCLLFLAT